ncbi:MAG: hypothetical protein SAMD01599839_07320 [Rectinema sp.]
MRRKLKGYIPAIFESDNQSSIIPAIEGLVYPVFCGASEAIAPDGPYGKLVQVLREHLDTHIYAYWLRTGSADFSATDQVDSSSGKALGSRFYPRLVTSILWLGTPLSSGSSRESEAAMR